MLSTVFRRLPTSVVLCSGLVLLLSYFTYVHNYASPGSLFWDENYHIASAQKYLNGVYFMEPHPPLGKLLIAWGEQLFDQNPIDNQFIATDYGRTLPNEFSFAGYRFFPVVIAWMTSLVIFSIFLVLSRNAILSLLLTFLYIFDNALIVHSRAAMLDPPMLLFTTLTILFFLLLREWKDQPNVFAVSSFLFGASFGLLMATKVLGLIVVLLVPVMLLILRKRWKQIVIFLGLAAAGFLIPYIAVWHIHFSLASDVNLALPDKGYYQASETYKQILDDGNTTTLAAFPVMLRDSLKFLGHYSKGVPKLNMCKEDENGSPFFYWPFGARAISYRWESAATGMHRYLYLVVNPVGWLLGLAGVVLAAAFLFAQWLLPLRQKLQNPELLLVFLGLYGTYMLAVARLDRVMYLYHYFIPLLLSYILFSLVLLEVRNIGSWKFTEERRCMMMLGLAVCVFLAFEWIRPFTYYIPISDAALKRREVLPLWEMTCATCVRDGLYYKDR